MCKSPYFPFVSGLLSSVSGLLSSVSGLLSPVSGLLSSVRMAHPRPLPEGGEIGAHLYSPHLGGAWGGLPARV